jgi:2-hydroxychromene-2-carboxylate isomerase
MADPVLDFWFDFASTYSYPAAARIRPLAAEAKVQVRFRPFLLGPIFKAQGWDTSPFNIYEAKGRYMWRDMERLAENLGLPFRRPDPFQRASHWSDWRKAGARIFPSRFTTPSSSKTAESTIR